MKSPRERSPAELLPPEFVEVEDSFSILKNETEDHPVYAFCDEGKVFMKVELG